MAFASSMREEACLLTSLSRAPPPAASNSTLLPGVTPKTSLTLFGIVTWPLLATDTVIGFCQLAVETRKKTRQGSRRADNRTWSLIRSRAADPQFHAIV